MHYYRVDHDTFRRTTIQDTETNWAITYGLLEFLDGLMPYPMLEARLLELMEENQYIITWTLDERFSSRQAHNPAQLWFTIEAEIPLPAPLVTPIAVTFAYRIYRLDDGTRRFEAVAMLDAEAGTFLAERER